MVYLDIHSATKLIERGRLAAEQTKHIDLGYFCVTNLVERGIIDIVYCPSLSMIAETASKKVFYDYARVQPLDMLHVPRPATTPVN